ncbi:hypothetical protein C5S42_12525 [Candidatus Methanomarinus sp.]|nr:hypothetical protein C5S42_12525 [ANME-2 cluster archaeon]
MIYYVAVSKQERKIKELVAIVKNMSTKKGFLL